MHSTPRPAGRHHDVGQSPGPTAPTTDDAARLTQDLIAGLGTTLVAALSGSRTSSAPAHWAAGDLLVPEEAAVRLRAAHTVWEALVGVEGDDIARAWFVGANPFLDQQPVLALREGRTDDVLASARAFLAGGWHL